MFESYHFNKRVNQRGITKKMISAVLEYGAIRNDKIILNHRTIENLLRKRKITKSSSDYQTIMKVLDKGGVTLVMSGGIFVTAYNCNFKNRRMVA